MLNPKYQIKVHQGIKALRLVMKELDFDQIFLFDELVGRWLCPIKLLKEETFLNLKRQNVDVVQIATSTKEKEWFFDSRFVFDQGTESEKKEMENLLRVLNFNKRNGSLKRI